MQINENLATHVRCRLAQQADVEEKRMFNVLAFMVNGKLCLGVTEHELLVRIHPDSVADVIESHECRQMMQGKKPMKGYLLIDASALRSSIDLNRWIDMALAFNPLANSSKRR